jgi:hypothetical protein
MAKSTSLLALQGTLGLLTFVKSSAYGDHVRTKRGTYTKAVVNDALKRENKMIASANVPAKIFKDAIDPYRDDVPGGQLWQRLVSLFRRQLNDNGKFDFSRMNGFEIHDAHPVERILSLQPTVTADKKKCFLHVTIIYDRHPNFAKVKDIDGYKFTLIAIYPDLKNKTATTVSTESKIISLADPITPLTSKLQIPAKAHTFIVCIKIEACINDRMTKTITTTGLCVIGGGAVGDAAKK